MFSENSHDTATQNLFGEVTERFGREMAQSLGFADTGWVWESDADHCMTWFSENFETVTGFSRYELLGKSRIEILNAAHRDDLRIVSHIHDLKAHKPFRNFLYHFNGEHGHSRWLVVSGDPRFDSAKNFLGYVGVGRDVTDMFEVRKSLEAIQSELEEKNAIIRSICEQVDTGILVFDNNDKLVIANSRQCEIFGMTEDQVPPGTPLRTYLERLYDSGHRDGDDEANRSAQIDQWQESFLHSSLSFEAQLNDGRVIEMRNQRMDNGYFIGIRRDVTEIKQSRTELAWSETENALFREILDNVEVAIYAKDPDLKLSYANTSWARLSGVSLHDALGKTDVEIFGPEGQSMMEDDRTVLTTGHAVHRDEAITSSDGKVRHCFARKSLLEGKDGRKHLIGSTTDVTSIHELRADMEAIISHMEMGVVLVDENLHCLVINDAFHRLHETKPEDFEESPHFRSVIEFNKNRGFYNVPDDSWDTYVDERLSVIKAGTGAPVERETKNGKTFIYAVAALSSGKRLITYFDITNRKERENALAQAVEKTRLAEEVLNSLDQGILVKDETLEIIFANRKFAELHKAEVSDFVGKRAAEFFGPDAAGFEASERGTLKSGDVIEIQEDYEEDGEQRSRLVHKSRVETDSGNPYVAITLTDVTEIRNRERALEVAEHKAQLSDRAKSEFLANMSHEIRTPMNGVLGMAELLAKSELDQKQKTFTDIIVKSGNALLTIINDILDFSKIDAGQLVLDPAPFNLRESIEDVATLVSAKAKEKQLEMIARVAPDLPDRFVGDVGRFRQIITNLMGNAVKFTEEGYVLVDVSGELTENGFLLKCKVTDTGIGIPQDKLETIFEKFSQVDTSASRRHEGTGLGLAITAKLVDMMGGNVGVESTVGKGSTFWFSIELPVEEGAFRKIKTVPVDVSGARVLIIDDNPVNRDILMEQMTAWAFDAFAVESGPKGLAMLKQAARAGNRADIVIVDYQMPDMTGDEVIRQIRTHEDIGDIPVVLLTSVDQALQPAMLRELEVDHHLLKPARSSHLLECIVGALQSRLGGGDLGDSALASIEDEAALNWLSGGATKTKSSQPVEATGEHSNKKSPPLFSDETSSPVVPASKEVAQHPNAAPPSPDKRDAKVDLLVAEDNEVNQLVYAQIFAQLDYTYEIVDNGKKAVEAVERLNPKIVLMDVSMPVMNGIEATETIRNNGEIDLPIIGITAHALKGDRDKCLSSGMSDYLPKPISPDRLAEKLAQWWPTAEKRLASGN
ncbi:MAG: response regulator [Pseudomonadota bacterium]